MSKDINPALQARRDRQSGRLNKFDKTLDKAGFEGGLQAAKISIVQVNIGLKCNLECAHCHVASGPWRKEKMDWETMEMVISAAEKVGAERVDITGGAPEMHPHFKRFVSPLRERGFDVMVRTNLTILLEEGFEDMAHFLADEKVHLVASLPCYLEENVDQQRGQGVYMESVKALQKLNELGYGKSEDLPLDLVYNPLGPKLPPGQKALEEDYKRELKERFAIEFTNLITITNMPIGRFWGDLKKEGKNQEYMCLLQNNFNPATVEPLMCRHQINIRWDGVLFDCDFNLALKMPLHEDYPRHIRDFDEKKLAHRKIVTANHCFGCTAGAGSSCGGALVEE